MRWTMCVFSAVVLLLAGAACSQRGQPTPGGNGGSVRVYFTRADKVATASRPVSDIRDKGQAVQALINGPNDFERSIGMSTEIPAGTGLLGLRVADGTATADLSGDFQSGGASRQLGVAEVVFTLTQFDDVRQVTITLNGKPLQGAVNIKRGDLEAVTPKLLVEAPTPGESVTSPVKVSGAANVFEGTVSYSVNAPDGKELDHGFTTATQQLWERWFAFGFTCSYPPRQHGLGHIVVWETSMKDGSHLNVYDVPVNM